MIKKTLLLMVVIFFTATLYSLSLNWPARTETQVKLEAQVFLYPISDDKAQTPAPLPSNNLILPVNDYTLNIPSLGLKAPIVFEPTTSESRIYSALEKGTVHYADTPVPGAPGTSIILGHSSSYSWYKGKYGSIFSGLSGLKEGDLIIINKQGQILKYEVTKSSVFSPKTADDFELREFESTDGSALVLMTCWPVGTNSKRTAVKAELI